MAVPAVLKCAACASNLRAQDFEPTRGLATCSYCGALMTFATPSAADERTPSRPEVPLPPKVRVTKTERGIELTRRWFSPVVVFLLFFCVAWDGFLVFWYSMAFVEGAPWIMVLFPVLHVAVGAALTYSTLAGLLNSTRISIGRRELEVRHGPIPWRGNRTLGRDRIEQLYCKRVSRRGKHGVTHSYEVWVALRDGTSSKLASDGLDEQQALFLEQRIEAALGLPDRPMAGELER